MFQGWFSWVRLGAVMMKEFIQMKRDRATLAMIVGIPLMQVILFGFAINSDPKQLPTALILADNSPYVRTFVQGLQNSGYFKIDKRLATEKQAEAALATGDVLFVINFPPDFTRKLIRDDNPSILIEADATDPAATSNAIGALNNLIQNVFQFDFVGQLQYLKAVPPKINLIVQRKYNPAGITQYNIVPGLLGVVLTMTMTMITAIAITRERDRGTMESLLATPVNPLEIILGKIAPYIIVGYIQISLIILVAHFLFGVPIMGSLFLLFLFSLPFIAANLSVGITISTIAKNPLQAVQMSVFFFLPSLLLSGFMFPFRGMPKWAQTVGELLPQTHYLRIVRGILIKGNHFHQVIGQVFPIVLFVLVMITIGWRKYQRTLD